MNNDIKIEIIENDKKNKNSSFQDNKNKYHIIKTVIITILIIIGVAAVSYYVISTTFTGNIITLTQKNDFKKEIKYFSNKFEGIYDDYLMLGTLASTDSSEICVSQQNNLTTICATVKGLVDSGYLVNIDHSNWKGYIKEIRNDNNVESITYNITNNKLLGTSNGNDINVKKYENEEMNKCTC